MQEKGTIKSLKAINRNENICNPKDTRVTHTHKHRGMRVWGKTQGQCEMKENTGIKRSPCCSHNKSYDLIWLILWLFDADRHKQD